MPCPRCGAETPGDNGPCPQCAPLSSASDTATVTRVAPTATTAPGTPRPAPFRHFAPGQSFSERYTIIEEVGTGGMGQVYKALDKTLGQPVALKLIRPDAAAHTANIERFRRELALAREVTHTNVCRVHDLGEQDGLSYLIMEFIEGQSLEDLIQSVGHLSPRQTVALGRQICAGLAAIHEKAIVHRDLKPGNIMVDRAGHARVMDFGMAYHHGQDRLTGAGGVMGTLAYLSPEQARGKPTDARSDIYAVGLILYEMLTGRRPPADGGQLPLALREPGEPCAAPSAISPEVPPPLDAVVMRCLERDPERRFTSAVEVEEALAAVRTAFSTGFSSTPIRVAPEPRRRYWHLAAIVLGLAVAVWVGDRLRRRDSPPLPPLGPRATVALLPLAYEGPPDKKYLRDSLPLILAEHLRASRFLQVAPFESSRRLANLDDMPSVARKLGVAIVVHGFLRSDRGAFTVSQQATGLDGATLWSRNYEGEPGSLIEKTEEAAAGLVAAVGGPRPSGQATSRKPQALEEYFHGRVLLEGWDVKKNLEQAESAFRAALRIDDGFAEAHAMLAVTLLARFKETGDSALMPQALEAATRAVALAPDHPETQAALGVVELGYGRSVEAAACFERGLELAPGDDSLSRRIARAYADLGRHREAEAYYRKAIELRPSFWISYNVKGVYHLRRNEFDQAEQLFSKAISLHPEGELGYLNLSNTYIHQGKFKDAEPVLRAGLQINPTADLRSNLGFVYYATGRFEEALREWQAARDAGAGSAITFSNLGDAYRQLGRNAEARDAYLKAVSLGREQLSVNPRDQEAHAWLAMALAGLGQCAESRTETALVVAQEPVEPTHHYYAALSHALCGRREAARHLAKALEGGSVMDVGTNPDLKPYRADPRVQELLRSRLP
jgi:eukaryotic-like serine/threonine-protein kinase